VVVVNVPREQVVTLSRRTHYLLPQMSAEAAVRTILRGSDPQSTLIVFPTVVQLIWYIYRWFSRSALLDLAAPHAIVPHDPDRSAQAGDFGARMLP
jgi:hypothetical protein